MRHLKFDAVELLYFGYYTTFGKVCKPFNFVFTWHIFCVILSEDFNREGKEGDLMEYLSHSEAETETVGETLGRTLRPGTVLAYRGDLGMGKTAFTRGLARGLGYTGRVTSPTFTIVNEYLGAIPLFHFDMYRLPDADALFDIGWEDYLGRGGVCAVEWSERVEDALPPDTLRVTLARHPQHDDWRIITVEGGETP